MKKAISVSLSVILAVFSSLAGVQAQEAVPQSPDQQFRQAKLSSTIDGIEIPQELLEYIQYYFEGHAVTKAEKIRRDGQELYRLRVDRDDLPNDYSSFLLVFDREWKFLQFEKQAPPPAPKPKPTKEKPKERQESNDNRGSNEEKDEEEKPAPEEPTTETTDDDETGSGELEEPVG